MMKAALTKSPVVGPTMSVGSTCWLTISDRHLGPYWRVEHTDGYTEELELFQIIAAVQLHCVRRHESAMLAVSSSAPSSSSSLFSTKFWKSALPWLLRRRLRSRVSAEVVL